MKNSFTTETHFFGGYYLVEGSLLKNWMNPLLIPKKFYSLSNCICFHHPDISILTWVDDTENRKKYRQKLGLTIKQFKALQNQADKWNQQNKYSWGEVFLDLNLAREFAANYLGNIQDIKLFAIATTAKYRELFLSEAPTANNSEGVYQALSLNQPIEIMHGFLGYEILGYEFGWFHSFVCNSLETDFANKLNIELNPYGLIDGYDSAIKANDYINHPNTGAEPVLWSPWAVMEVDIAP